MKYYIFQCDINVPESLYCVQSETLAGPSDKFVVGGPWAIAEVDDTDEVMHVDLIEFDTRFDIAWLNVTREQTLTKVRDMYPKDDIYFLEPGKEPVKL